MLPYHTVAYLLIYGIAIMFLPVLVTNVYKRNCTIQQAVHNVIHGTAHRIKPLTVFQFKGRRLHAYIIIFLLFIKLHKIYVKCGFKTNVYMFCQNFVCIRIVLFYCNFARTSWNSRLVLFSRKLYTTPYPPSKRLQI